MTQRERELLGRIYGVIDKTSGLRARNPADVKTISRYHFEMERVLRPLKLAVSSLGFGELGECAEELDAAEVELERALRG